MSFYRHSIMLMLLAMTSATQAASVFSLPIEESAEEGKLRFIQTYADSASQLAYGQYQHALKPQVAELFGKHKKLSREQFLQAQHTWVNQQFAQEREGHIKQTNIRFASIDFDKNGSIDLREFQQTGLKSFDRYDTDKNGIINQQDRGEDEQAMQALRRADNTPNQRRLKGLLAMPTTHSITGFVQLYQTNGSTLSQAQYLSHREQQFAQTDRNTDGVLSAAEYEAEFMQRVEQTAQKVQPQLTAHFEQVFGQADQNADGQLTLKEFEQFKRQQFQYWDTNQDSVIDDKDSEPKA